MTGHVDSDCKRLERFAVATLYKHQRIHGAQMTTAVAAWIVWTMRGHWYSKQFARDFKAALRLIGRKS